MSVVKVDETRELNFINTSLVLHSRFSHGLVVIRLSNNLIVRVSVKDRRMGLQVTAAICDRRWLAPGVHDNSAGHEFT